MNRDLSWRKEGVGNAFVQAVAAKAGFICHKPDFDLDCVDWGISGRGGEGTVRSPKLELQLKCTARDLLDEDSIHYPLDVNTYDNLRAENYLVPRILLVVIMPESPSDWISQSDEQLSLRHFGYWVSLRGKPRVENRETVTVYVPLFQTFTIKALKNIMKRIEAGGLP